MNYNRANIINEKDVKLAIKIRITHLICVWAILAAFEAIDPRPKKIGLTFIGYS